VNKRDAGRARPIVVLGLVVLLPVVVLAGLWRWAAGQADAGSDPTEAPAPAAAPPPPTPALATPLLSFRRLPGIVARDVSQPALERAVAEVGATLDETSCLAVALDGAPVGSVGADRPVIPASNQKLLVAAVALDVLGPDATFTTDVRAAPPADGVVVGDLYLVGGGDPLLTSSTFPVQDDQYPVTTPTSLDALADAVVAAGVQRVDGSVVGDGSRYDDEWFVPSWSEGIRGVEAGPYDALMVNDARVTGDPSKVADPAVGAAAELTSLLEARGVVVSGEPKAGAAPPEMSSIASVTSAPMSAVVAELLTTSDDNTAELLVKELGAAAGTGGTREAGLEVIRRTMEGWGVPMVGVAPADGSGLSNDNRLTCAALLAVLVRSGPDGPLAIGLPVAGQSGTLADELTASPVTGRMHAKTGSLGNAPHGTDPPAVKSLSGYLPVDGGGALEFALILNGATDLTEPGIYRPVWDRLAEALASYPTGPTPEQLGPR
jgi:D-alanyl-D-alanine carboxypeptidase/D-alanyl-D-alanine-endopeptidase (penicillin-binding protein 4)